ncbi:MAG: hypothetical protein KKD39_02995 [Candidatus Altiarchaeota archaeon]|nr:hypothetical protein [Candidatus Altiarchaeota archaeon]
MEVKKFSVGFDFYGVTAVISSESQDIIDGLRRDFGFFERSGIEEGVKIWCYLGEVEYDGLGGFKAVGYGKDSISFASGESKIVDYRGKALSIYDFSTESGKLISPDPARLYELSYLLLLSRVGELLDLKGMHRVHGFAINAGSDGVLALLPEGCGKTTLFTSIIGLNGIQALSDDTPLIKGDMLFAFPTRISMCKSDSKDIPSKHKRKFIRTDRQTKYLVNLDYFSPTISDPVKLKRLVICERNLSQDASINKASRLRAIWPLTRDMVFGLGVPQLVEHFLRNTPEDTLKKAAILIRRIWTALRAICSSQTYMFKMGLNKEVNARVLSDFLSKIDARI